MDAREQILWEKRGAGKQYKRKKERGGGRWHWVDVIYWNPHGAHTSSHGTLPCLWWFSFIASPPLYISLVNMYCLKLCNLPLLYLWTYAMNNGPLSPVYGHRWPSPPLSSFNAFSRAIALFYLPLRTGSCLLSLGLFLIPTPHPTLW